jgi:hypothetical protein
LEGDWIAGWVFPTRISLVSGLHGRGAHSSHKGHGKGGRVRSRRDSHKGFQQKSRPLVGRLVFLSALSGLFCLDRCLPNRKLALNNKNQKGQDNNQDEQAVEEHSDKLLKNAYLYAILTQMSSAEVAKISDNFCADY